MKRKILTVLLATIAYTTLVGCGSSQEPATASYEETGPAVYADEAEEEPAISTEPATSVGLEDVTGENDDRRKMSVQYGRRVKTLRRLP